ncbi:MAG: hypothetical protein GF364_15420 [Candidatus Lokiarchaeota archaeon]|nr:hypothetical protein [Candidatus Lokiarchaeota archaeon]
MLKILAETTFKEENYQVTCGIIYLNTGFLLLITDQTQYGMGNVFMSAPSGIDGTKAISTPGPIFGFKRNILGKMVSELAATILKKPCLILINIRGLEKKDKLVADVTMKCLKQTLNQSREKIKKME